MSSGKTCALITSFAIYEHARTASDPGERLEGSGANLIIMDNRGMTQLSSEKPELFKGRHFNHLLIIQAMRWYVIYKLSYRDMCDLMEERGVTVVHTTVLRWA